MLKRILSFSVIGLLIIFTSGCFGRVENGDTTTKELYHPDDIPHTLELFSSLHYYDRGAEMIYEYVEEEEIEGILTDKILFNFAGDDTTVWLDKEGDVVKVIDHRDNVFTRENELEISAYNAMIGAGFSGLTGLPSQLGISRIKENADIIVTEEVTVGNYTASVTLYEEKGDDPYEFHNIYHIGDFGDFEMVIKREYVILEVEFELYSFELR